MKIGPVEKIRDLVNLQLPGIGIAGDGGGAAADSVSRRLRVLRARSHRRAVARAEERRRHRRASVRRVRRISRWSCGRFGVEAMSHERHPGRSVRRRVTSRSCGRGRGAGPAATRDAACRLPQAPTPAPAQSAQLSALHVRPQRMPRARRGRRLLATAPFGRRRIPLLQAAAPLLVLAGRLRGQIAQRRRREPAPPGRCRKSARSRNASRRAGVPAEDVLAARYALCTVIDEAVLNTPWGAQSDWSGQSLLVTFHRESAGGEKFFQILDRVIRRAAALSRACSSCCTSASRSASKASTAWTSAAPRGSPRFARTCIARIQGVREQRRSRSLATLERRRGPAQRRRPLRAAVGRRGRVRACCCSARTCSSTPSSASAPEPSTPRSRNVGVEPLYTAAPAAPGAAESACKQLLAPQIAQRPASRSREAGGRTLITLTAAGPVRFGQREREPRYDELIARRRRAR